MVRLKLLTGTVTKAVGVDDLLVKASSNAAIDEFHDGMKLKYSIKRLEIPKIFLGWFFHYKKDGTIALSKRLLIDKTLAYTGMIHGNGK